jgi:hypothetical protein
MNLLPCPCCDFLTVERYGACEICPVCDWEDDYVLPENGLDQESGPNHMTIREGRQKFAARVAAQGLPVEASRYARTVR